MVETKPVHPDLRSSVVQALDADADAKLVPSAKVTDRPGVIKLLDGVIHTHRMDDFDVVGTSVRGDNVLLHVERA